MTNGMQEGLIKIGTVLNDKWVVLELIGKGGMGEVYRVHQLNLKRDAAIKIVSQELLQTFDNDEREVETARSRFHREVKAMAQVRHPNVVQIFDFGSVTLKNGEQDFPVEYIAMEYIPGSTLRYTMSEEGFYPDEKLVADWVCEYFFPVLDGVQAMHEAGIIHRDIKPENFLMDGDIPKIADFGLARSARLEPVTLSEDMKGTPPYMAPEHFLDFRRVDQRGDIYSLGKILYEAVEGKMPFNAIPFKSAKLNKPNTPFFQVLDRVIQDATAEDRDNRFESVKKFRTALQQAVDDFESQSLSDTVPSYRKPPAFDHLRWLWVGIVAAILSVAAMTVWHLTGNPWIQKPLLENHVFQQQPAKEKVPGPAEVSSPPSGVAAKSIMGQDGITMRLIPGGNLKTETDAGKAQGDTVHLESFYMDETKATIHHFAEFLNSVINELIVENGVVKHDNEIWFLLGEGVEKYDQIIYQHNRFHIREPKYAGQPVVRVTWYGASAYAHYFDKRLPTENEWEYAAQKIGLQKQKSPESKPREEVSSGSEANHHMMDVRSDSGSGRTNKSFSQAPTQKTEEFLPQSEIGLKGMGGDIKEWVIRKAAVQKPGEESKTNQLKSPYSSLIIGKPLPAKDLKLQGVIRKVGYPWEGFFDVGFRCAASINSN
ncbi:MAG: protein kinase [Deltaproteobacteria bacterium]|nr:protein kinase [Deltaproteobacteria bacterium]MBW2052328.1 protein kinase [Deltaproteobacteria bacterium]MBW2140219.1 protein kinase [Deltaproteobacteria bacterium]MBW2323469.1 protein kinase [Deltaproteobacteria bacterium]